MENSIDFSNFHCTSCGSNLVLKYLNEKNQMLVCSNKQVKYIFNYFFSVSFLLIVKICKNLFLMEQI
jgi:ssDNA-binding Zn-finger/Zn-ribbon topoisomerase 1